MKYTQIGLRTALSLCFTISAFAQSIDIIGREYGVSSHTQDVDEVQARKVVMDADQGLNTDALYFSALLSLYGKGGIKQDASKAATLQFAARKVVVIWRPFFLRFRIAAERGHASSQTALGVLLRNGFGVSRDDNAAFAWLSTGAKAQHVDSMWILGVMYLDGTAPSVNHTRARYWLQRAVSQDSPDGMHWLGVMDEYGLCVPNANFTSAAYWYKRASDRGHAAAAYNLGLMHAYGRGFNQDFQRALVLFQLAAGRGHAGAMYYIGVMHLYGQGLDVNYDLARAWFKTAESTNDRAFSKRASDARRELELSVGMASALRQEKLDMFIRIFDAGAPDHDRAAFENDNQGRITFDVRPFDSLNSDPFDNALSDLEREGEKLETVDDDAFGGEGMPDYHNQLASAYYRIAAAEAEQEELLDEISQHQLTIAELQAELRLSVKSVTQTRVELEKVNAHLESAQRDQEREEQERREFQKQLDSVQNSVDQDDEEVPISNVLRDLINTKTELAEITAERDRRRLEKKHLEEELAKVKCELAAVIADVEDTEVELRNLREENVKSGIPNIPL